MFRHLLATLRIVLIFMVIPNAYAQQPPPVAANPQAPTLAATVPLGMQRGTGQELTLTGTNLTEPVALWTSFSAKATFPADNNNGKDAARLRVRLEVPRDIPIGLHTVRLATTRGVSNFRTFCIDDLPQVNETDTNRAKASAQPVPIPCVIVGRADAEASDFFKVHVKAGERLTFEVLARRLGSPLDPQVTLYDAKSGKELPAGHSNDAPGLQTDARLTYTFKEAGEVLVEVRDATYRGGPDYGYRLRIGDFPCATSAMPMAVKRGGKALVGFAGPLVGGIAPVEVTVPDDPTVTALQITPRAVNGLHGWPIFVAISDLDEGVEQEPNNEPAKANRVAVPGAVTGRFQEAGDIDHFIFAAKKGQRLLLDVETHELGSPTEVYLVLRDAKGTQVAMSNPTVAARIDFNPPADGDYTLAVEHLLYWGGPAETYRLTIRPYEPGYTLTLGIDRFDVPPGGVVPVGIFLARRDYNGPIEVSVAGPAGVSGQVAVATGQNAPPNQPVAQLFLRAAPQLAAGTYPITIQGKATINDKPIVERASVRAVVAANLSSLPYPPPTLTHQVALGVTEKPPFTLVLKLDHPEGTRGQPVGLTVTATRVAGFAEEIALTPVNLPANVAPALKNVPKDKNEIQVQLNPAANAALGTFTVSVSGKAKHAGKEYAFTAVPASLVLVPPFELKADAAPLTLEPGGKGVLKITATRKGGYQGPIALEIRNLPANVTAAKATIAAGQQSAEVEVTAAANAAAGEKADVNVLGTASAAANQQAATPNFKVAVKKK